MLKRAHDQEILLSQGYVFDQNFLSQGYPMENWSRTPPSNIFRSTTPPSTGDVQSGSGTPSWVWMEAGMAIKNNNRKQAGDNQQLPWTREDNHESPNEHDRKTKNTNG